MVKTNMYYEDNRDLAHDVQELSVELLGLPLHFLTDAGVFSKNAIDYGSRVLLDNFQPEGAKTLLDVGCGYGTLALTLAKKFDLKVTLVDVNSRALDLAKKNADKNNIKVDNIFLSNIYDNVEQSFDAIISNPPIRAGKEVVHAILSDAYTHLNNNGHLTIVIQKKQGAPSAQKKMNAVFGNCEVVAKDKGYYILRSYKEEL
ncbi:class I SAM-dependent methyltransferase [Lactococcus formosensis]|jgi:16S RNA G1207 methylase RsmC|uniref:Class I SAM-dependent methyltransferase n=1 Tax=Lactococcus formosensis TaxID=1281486 RepID=A0A9Q8Y0Z9_9LACT|nr:class I SAM-dependent methyltransferase [Lactococcus formosensis]MCH1722082.1 class I SAM-dependent methyltransferase [Lactococcus formosensis]MDG6110968.1 class I SAM-dependent methyltransferase [Lactococcus formosensis]MDG6113807.1 class I SAM-dependent methyltransferase [Lactococcus formosensis]MDG6115788.1 class I SAM-dependent methyltransferase [Lactococcus formosensis]MDG6117424.1 class I SAM-dependent methyltransferase [Lactococcus formosensis]